MILSWLRRRRATEDDRQRAEALVEVEIRGMMGGRPPELRLTPVIRPPRMRPVEERYVTYEGASDSD
jgi:hypothetical protein